MSHGVEKVNDQWSYILSLKLNEIVINIFVYNNFIVFRLEGPVVQVRLIWSCTYFLF